MKLEDKQFKQIETQFRNRCIAQQVKYNSEKFKKLQAEFFAGAMAALNAAGFENAVYPMWVIAVQSSREIIEPYKLI